MYGRKMLLKRCQRDQLKKDYIKQGQQYLDCWVMENGDLLTASKNKSACKLSRKIEFFEDVSLYGGFIVYLITGSAMSIAHKIE